MCVHESMKNEEAVCVETQAFGSVTNIALGLLGVNLPPLQEG